MKSLPMPPVWSGPLPEAAPPPGMSIYQIPTGTYGTRAALAFKGGSFRDKRQFAATAILLQHPQGDLLIDAGFGSRVAAHLPAYAKLSRPPYEAGRTAREQLDACGYDLSGLSAVPTHSHWDHVSGLGDLEIPIWVTEGELRYAREARDGKAFRDVSAGREIRQYECTGPSHLGFPSSFDVYGDGSVVIVLAGGHTTGSVIVFASLPTGKRYAFIGDLTWQLDGIRLRAERPFLMQKLADVDPARLRENLLRVTSIADLMQIVPAHDLSAYDGIPQLPAGMTSDSAPEDAG
jgi:N-acyl homoserine lactone hydrolase